VSTQVEPLTEEQAAAWVAAYERAWRAGDAEQAAALFTPDCVYRSHPFRAAEDAAGYSRRAFAGESEVEARFGSPLVDGRRVAVEYWATLREDGEEATLAGCDVLRFAADGRCCELCEYWSRRSGRVDAPHGWGL
jgi:nuclear transport factor 2 (NTF2) superfamily protein